MGRLSADPEIAKVGARDLVMEARDTHPTDPDGKGCRRGIQEFKEQHRERFLTPEEWRRVNEALMLIPAAESDSTPTGCTLEQTCAVLGLDVDRVRGQAWKIVTRGFKVPIRRRRLSPAVRKRILVCLSRGMTPRELGKQFGVNPATVRKVRIRARRQAGEGAAA